MDAAANVAGLLAFSGGFLSPLASRFISSLFYPTTRLESLKAQCKVVEHDLEEVLERGRAPNVRFLHDMYRNLDRIKKNIHDLEIDWMRSRSLFERIAVYQPFLRQTRYIADQLSNAQKEIFEIPGRGQTLYNASRLPDDESLVPMPWS
ncbi:hypothetical protein PUNSTDRAFT_121145 [Punctularia strigosozonata HHB-11173 SS5]|uniref:uncharacterized protein n=1 Tax=Punctularia strigosozonata (strain HHB-11173) TaxID=741275 RepID=UPI0004417B3E|nr:uncharacterized protein PUNSTDRAFT_121145 [Punctularia strigosozonata HHB-11173 SS5]EIN07984.1 hypothetical protein PUNSTDRAFT_121145 [Punctularia strigosozonata HHB-11173 SS5]